jgi:hypothetical protein
MKKTLLSIFTILGLEMTSQTLTYANHAPAWGNIPFQTAQCDSVGISPGSIGAASSWSFNPTGLNSAKTYTTSNSMPTNTLFPASNVAVYYSATDIAYYKSDVSALKYYGGNFKIKTSDLFANYSNPAIFAIYPMSLNTNTTSVTSGTITITQSPFPAITGTFTGACTLLADESGTLTLPSKTFTNVLRVVTSQTITVADLGISLNLVVYDYYSPGTSKAPILSINSSTIVSGLGTSEQTIVTVQPNYDIVSINESQKEDIQLSVFPNPATNLINFTTTSPEATKVIAYDITGKIIGTELIESGKSKMNTSNFTSGIYIYHVVGKNNQILKSGKFAVSK